MFRHAYESKSYLVVDDFGDMRSMLKNTLRMLGISDIDTASNGKETITALERKHYDVVLCDYNLGPGKDGQQVLEEARHRNLISLSTVFIMVTAESAREMVLGAIEYEPDSYLSKPFSKDLLRTRLEKLLEKKAVLAPVEQALKQKNYAQALSLVDQQLAKKPKNPAELIRLKATICVEAGKYAEAMAIYERVLASREIPWARMGIGQVFFKQKKIAEAREIFQRLIEMAPNLTTAYDWLARCHRALGANQDAQAVLQSALELSPKAILRQQTLGDLAIESKNYDVAENAYGKAVRLGKHSVFKHPSMYAGLAKSKTSQSHHDDALKVVRELEKEFGSDREATIYAQMSESQVLNNVGDAEGAARCLAHAAELYEHFDGGAPGRMTLELAKAAASLGDDERAAELLKSAVRNNHDDDDFLLDAVAAFRDAGISEDPEALVDSLRHEIVEMNNMGVRMLKQGQIGPAIELFEKAADSMVANRALNLNAARALIMAMEQSGTETESLGKVRTYLERVKRVAPDDASLLRVTERFHRLVSSS